MSQLRLNDIWRNVGQEIGFYTTETFKNVPTAPGVYAWFYPLRIVTNNIYEFMDEVNIILNYDCVKKGKPFRDFKAEINWEIFSHSFEVNPKEVDLTAFESIWDDISSDQNEFDELRKVIMRASIFLPPLYVGKTTNLNKRCKEHINGISGNNDFHRRFEEYATTTNSKIKNVNELLFVAIKTKEEEGQSTRTEELVEAIIKYLSKPKYSKI